MAFPDPGAGVTRISLQSSGLILFYSGTTIINQVKKTGYVRMSNDLKNLMFSDTDGSAFPVPSIKITQVDTPTGIWTYSTVDPATQATSSDDIATRTQSIFETLAKYVFIACCDSDCDCGGDGCYSATNTYANWELARLGGFLPQGCWIRVTDIPSQPSAVFALFCTSTTEVSLGGRGTFLNADWQNVGDYSGVFAITGVAFTANVGQWYVGLEGTAVDGDVVIWNCLHYQVIDAASFAGTNPATNTTAYTLLPKATANTGYISEVDDIEFDFPNDWLQYRSDKRGNTYRYSQSIDSVFLLGQTGIDFFQWGRDSWYGNSCDNGLIDQINFVGSIFKNALSVFAAIRNNIGASTSEIQLNNLSSSAQIENNTFGANSIMFNTQLAYGGFIGNTIDPSILFSDNTITGGSVVNNKFFQANYERNTIGVDFTFMESNSTLVIQTMHIPGNSTQIRDLDITGVSSLNISTNAELVGIYNLTSGNATETITDFVDATWPTLFPFTLKPVAGLIVTINFTSVGSLSASGQIVDGSSFIVLDGDNGDSATFETATIGGFNVVKLVEITQNT